MIDNILATELKTMPLFQYYISFIHEQVSCADKATQTSALSKTSQSIHNTTGADANHTDTHSSLSTLVGSNNAILTFS